MPKTTKPTTGKLTTGKLTTRKKAAAKATKKPSAAGTKKPSVKTGKPLFVFAHGAGASSSSDWMQGWAARLRKLGCGFNQSAHHLFRVDDRHVAARTLLLTDMRECGRQPQVPRRDR
jgi:hypothetical protein